MAVDISCFRDISLPLPGEVSHAIFVEALPSGQDKAILKIHGQYVRAIYWTLKKDEKVRVLQNEISVLEALQSDRTKKKVIAFFACACMIALIAATVLLGVLVPGAWWVLPLVSSLIGSAALYYAFRPSQQEVAERREIEHEKQELEARQKTLEDENAQETQFLIENKETLKKFFQKNFSVLNKKTLEEFFQKNFSVLKDQPSHPVVDGAEEDYWQDCQNVLNYVRIANRFFTA